MKLILRTFYHYFNFLCQSWFQCSLPQQCHFCFLKFMSFRKIGIPEHKDAKLGYNHNMIFQSYYLFLVRLRIYTNTFVKQEMMFYFILLKSRAELLKKTLWQNIRFDDTVRGCPDWAKVWFINWNEGLKNTWKQI